MVMECAHVTGYANVNVLVAGSNPVGVNVHPTFYFMVPLFYIKSLETYFCYAKSTYKVKNIILVNIVVSQGW